MALSTPIVAGNWKLNHGIAETRAFFGDFLPRVAAHTGGTIAICPPALALTTAAAVLGSDSRILLGIQNVYSELTGAYTGENSAAVAREAGAALALIGHSERRHIFGEQDDECGRKVRAALDAGLIAVLCVGETLDEREAGRAFEMVERQLVTGIAPVQATELDRLLIAYEPVWAIGTGRTASPDDAAEMHAKIRTSLAATWGDEGAALPILYGGSVKVDNAAQLLAAPGVDGLLVGGASLDPAGFAAICSARG